ncbi:GDE1 family protein [Megaselia abdita]
MFYTLILYLFTFISFSFNTICLLCKIASFGIPWFTLMIVFICVTTRFIKLEKPEIKHLFNIVGDSTDLNLGIVNRGGTYDCPENSFAALKECEINGLQRVLLDAGLTKCGEIAIVHKITLEKANIPGNISENSLHKIREINISQYHPFATKYPDETIFTLSDLLFFLKSSNIIVFLLISDSSSTIFEKLENIIANNKLFAQRIILTTRSPIIIYKLRRLHPELICALWTKKPRNYLRSSTLIGSFVGAIVRNIISPVIGITFVFINKEELNLQMSLLWKNVGVKPVGYTVNSPNEKKYFQNSMKTHYLTDSIRSEPNLIIKKIMQKRRNHQGQYI